MRSSAHARYGSWPQPSSPSCPSQAPTASAYTRLANLTRIIWLRGSKRRTPLSSTRGMLDTGQRIPRRKERNHHTRKTVSMPVLVVDAAPRLLRRPTMSESVDAGWMDCAAQPLSIVNSTWANTPGCCSNANQCTTHQHDYSYMQTSSSGAETEDRQVVSWRRSRLSCFS